MSERRLRDDQLPRGAGSAAAVPPVPSASVILLRNDPFQVLMMRRNEASTFVPGAWVFPGGALDDTDARSGEDEDLSLRRCAVREVFEETGIWLGSPFDGHRDARRRLLGGEPVMADLEPHLRDSLARLVLTARWITPVGVPKRYDTRFFLAEVGDDVEGTPDTEEGLELLWLRPAEALRRHAEGTFPLVFPTIRNLEALLPYTERGSLLAARRAAEIPTIQPVLVVRDGQKTIVIPGEA
jgi:recombination protein RecT